MARTGTMSVVVFPSSHSVPFSSRTTCSRNWEGGGGSETLHSQEVWSLFPQHVEVSKHEMMTAATISHSLLKGKKHAFSQYTFGISTGKKRKSHT